MRHLCFGIVLASIASAQAMAAPEKLDGTRIQALLNDRILIADDIEQIFQTNGQTIYIEGGQPSQGTWFVSGDRYCSTWPPSHFESCFDVLTQGNEVIFVGSSGKRYVMHLKP